MVSRSNENSDNDHNGRQYNERKRKTDVQLFLFMQESLIVSQI